MEMVRVESSNIEAVGYDADKQELRVRFTGGATYIYREVPKDIFDQFMAAPSKGRYLATVIKPGYPCQKLETEN